MGENGGSGLKRVFVEQDGSIVAVSAGVELARGMPNVVTDFLENHRVEASADCTEDLCGAPACWAWVPLEHGEAALVVHAVTDRVGEEKVKGRVGDTKS